MPRYATTRAAACFPRPSSHWPGELHYKLSEGRSQQPEWLKERGVVASNPAASTLTPHSVLPPMGKTSWSLLLTLPPLFVSHPCHRPRSGMARGKGPEAVRKCNHRHPPSGPALPFTTYVLTFPGLQEWGSDPSLQGLSTSALVKKSNLVIVSLSQNSSEYS